MRKLVTPLLLLMVFGLFAQTPNEDQSGARVENVSELSPATSRESAILTGDFKFNVTHTGKVNSGQSEYGSGFFQAKYIIISSRKIGGIGGEKDPLTGEPHTQIYCSTIKGTGDLEKPLLFSRILNTENSEGSIAFSPDQKTVYYTRAKKDNTRFFKMYRATDEKIQGNWDNPEAIHFNSDQYSVENPWISRDGKKLYFASNMQGSYGGYDIYVADIGEDNTIGDPVNLGPEVNTAANEKFPFIDKNNKYFYFSSDGHNTRGGYDVFRARKVKDTYVRPVNLGPSINSPQDEIAFMFANEKRGYVTSSKQSKETEGGNDVYKFVWDFKKQILSGVVLDVNTKKKLPGSDVQVVDVDGNVIGTKVVGPDAKFTFYVDPYERYIITSKKEGFNDKVQIEDTNSAVEKYFNVTIEMEQEAAEIVEVEGKKLIKIENIYFDFDKATIKPVSEISLNKIVKVLNDNPEMEIEVNAHTD
ncbi:MAG: PD40 domain-containing protein, partial [Flavobacteriaceae bacterium]|nr:PD40 domain-containing protein [Flavobacteriaceae bacterium]